VCTIKPNIILLVISRFLDFVRNVDRWSLWNSVYKWQKNVCVSAMKTKLRTWQKLRSSSWAKTQDFVYVRVLLVHFNWTTNIDNCFDLLPCCHLLEYFVFCIPIYQHLWTYWDVSFVYVNFRIIDLNQKGLKCFRPRCGYDLGSKGQRSSRRA